MEHSRAVFFCALFAAAAVGQAQPVGDPGLARTADGMTGVAPAHDRARTTPVEKVIELLERLAGQVQEEGKAEAAAYDKFACFCKEQADEKLYSITKAKEKISMLTAHIESLEAEIAELDRETAATRKEKTALEKDAEAAAQVRDSELKAFETENEDLLSAVDALERAIAALEESKEGMVDAKLSLVRQLAKKVLKQVVMGSKMQVTPRQLKALYAFLDTASTGRSTRGDVFLQVSEPGKPHAYEYHSNDIIAILKSLLQTFKQKSRDLVSDEQNNKHGFGMSQQARQNQIKAYEDLIAKNEEISGAKSDEKAGKEQDKKETSTAMGYDQNFLDDLTGECEDKATSWDERSKIRAAELTALSEAIGLLKGSVSENYSANKKLVGLVAEGESTDDDEDDSDEEDVSFLQRRKKNPKRKVLKYLAGMARNLKSPILSTLVMKLKEDHFVKVRGIIKDLIARLEAEAEAEASQKAWCDEEVGKTTEKRDDNQAKIEKQNAAITEGEAKVVALTEDITVLGNEIADLYKALKEATELREDEHAENTQTIADAKAGLDAVTQAIEVLKKFYDNPTGEFMQYEPWRAENADASGKTVKDLAPETFEGDYKGKQQESEGIFGLLEIIKSDFERTVKTTEETEAEAEKAFQDMKTKTEADIDAKKTEKEEKEGTKKDTEADLVDFKDELKDATTLKAEALEELEKLKPACMDTGMSWKERTARREQEIEALKEALHILETAFD